MSSYLRPGEGWLKWLYIGVGIYSAALTTTVLYFQSRQMLPPVREGASRFDDLAEVYDQQLGWDEFMMGLDWIRRWYVGLAYGKVLEISAGTGRNYQFYDFAKIQSLTITDSCYPMLREAKDKFEQWNNSRWFKINQPLYFKLIDAENMCHVQSLPQAPEKPSLMKGLKIWLTGGQKTEKGEEKQDHGPEQQQFSIASEMSALQQLSQFELYEFDTIVDTFGLCSHSDPVEALRQVQMVCKPHGRIILIEHGISNWKWLNNRLNQDADKHKQKWGCSWNRDIEKIVSEAGLIVETQERYHFGSTYVFICKPGQKSQQQ